MKKFLSFSEEFLKQLRWTKTATYLSIFALVLFLSLALTLPNHLLKKQQIIRSNAQVTGATYYVDSVDGSDANSGISSSTHDLEG
jgi:hypothetical protein